MHRTWLDEGGKKQIGVHAACAVAASRGASRKYQASSTMPSWFFDHVGIFVLILILSIFFTSSSDRRDA
jgi:hypothetical protein